MTYSADQTVWWHTGSWWGLCPAIVLNVSKTGKRVRIEADVPRVSLEGERIKYRAYVKPTSLSARSAQNETKPCIQRWMRAPNPMLGGAVPLDMMYQGMGRRVAQFIDSAYQSETSVEPVSGAAQPCHLCGNAHDLMSDCPPDGERKL